MRSKSIPLFGRMPRGETVIIEDSRVVGIPKRPRAVCIPGDGIGPEIWVPVKKIVRAANRKVYKGERGVVWVPAYAGAEAQERFGTSLPDRTLKLIDLLHVGVKGPLRTGKKPTSITVVVEPSKKPARSLNVKLRVMFNMDQCIRPIHYIEGVPSPVVRPGDLDVVIFRQNTEGPYTGISFMPGSNGADRMISTAGELGHSIPPGSGIDLSFASQEASKNLVRKAIQFAIEHGRQVVTIVAKSNNLPATDGAFLTWGLEVAHQEFGDIVIDEDEFWNVHKGVVPAGKILINHKITDDMFQQIILYPKKYSVIATTNLNGDYLSDAAAAIHGGIGQAAGTNKGPHHIVYEPTHGTADDIAGQNKANPTSLLLSVVMMLRDFHWDESADLIDCALAKTIAQKKVTSDFARYIEGATTLGTTEFGDAIIANMGK